MRGGNGLIGQGLLQEPGVTDETVKPADTVASASATRETTLATQAAKESRFLFTLLPVPG